MADDLSHPPIVAAAVPVGGKLKSLVERIERLEEDKAARRHRSQGGLRRGQGRGLRHQDHAQGGAPAQADAAKRSEEEALIELYHLGDRGAVKRKPPDRRAQAKRAALNALRRAKRAADRAGMALTTGKANSSARSRPAVETFGRAFGDPEKGAARSALSARQGVKLKEIAAKASGKQPRQPKGRRAPPLGNRPVNFAPVRAKSTVVESGTFRARGAFTSPVTSSLSPSPSASSLATASPPHDPSPGRGRRGARDVFGPKFRDFERLFPIFRNTGIQTPPGGDADGVVLRGPHLARAHRGLP